MEYQAVAYNSTKDISIAIHFYVYCYFLRALLLVRGLEQEDISCIKTNLNQ